ncbi:MAG: FhaA domain-containing protein [Actinomycetota bacterium]
MGILRDFESRLERVVEGFFTKAFRSGVQPVELAKRVLKELDAGKTVSVKGVWVPNRYRILLSPDDHARFANIENAVERELEQVAVEGAKERGYGMVARPAVILEASEELKRGEFLVKTEITEETGGPPPPELALTGEKQPALVLLRDGKPDKEYPISGNRAVIGRIVGSEVQIDDPGASRRHAEIRREGNEFVLADLGSTNGTLLNDSEITEETLRDGDRITIGATTLEFRSP